MVEGKIFLINLICLGYKYPRRWILLSFPIPFHWDENDNGAAELQNLWHGTETDWTTLKPNLWHERFKPTGPLLETVPILEAL